jgi:hypothetical protein
MELKVAVRRVEDKLICRLKGVASFFFFGKKERGVLPFKYKLESQYLADLFLVLKLQASEVHYVERRFI